MKRDPWLDKWQSMLKAHAADGRVLEVGCGSGDDTETLVAAGLRVVAFDADAATVERARARVPGAEFHCASVLDRFPLEGSGVPVIVASLCLHYFPWRQTVEVVERLRQTLAPGGRLLCRLNSTEDFNYGAIGHPQIEPHFFSVDGKPKRFFDRASIDRLFGHGWHLRYVKDGTTEKYGPRKALWELEAERDA